MTFLEGSVASVRLRVRCRTPRYHLHYASIVTLVMNLSHNRDVDDMDSIPD